MSKMTGDGVERAAVLLKYLFPNELAPVDDDLLNQTLRSGRPLVGV